MNFKKILVAVDASENSARAVNYTGIMTHNLDDLKIELLYVERLPERDTFPDEQSWKNACMQQKAGIETFLEKSRDELARFGISRELVSLNYLSVENYYPLPNGGKSRGVASQIMQAQQQGDFGTVVVGRRGMTKAEEFLFGSVSTKIIHHIKNCTVWVVE